jgi:hypothetical protein
MYNMTNFEKQIKKIGPKSVATGTRRSPDPVPTFGVGKGPRQMALL